MQGFTSAQLLLKHKLQQGRIDFVVSVLCSLLVIFQYEPSV